MDHANEQPQQVQTEPKVDVITQEEEIDYGQACGNYRTLAESYWEELRIRLGQEPGSAWERMYDSLPDQVDQVVPLTVTSDGSTERVLSVGSKDSPDVRYAFNPKTGQVLARRKGEAANMVEQPIQDDEDGLMELVTMTHWLFDCCEQAKQG